MKFFERFIGSKKNEPGPQATRKREVVPDFQINEELESLISEYEQLGTTLFGITHDMGIDMTTTPDNPRIQASPELQKGLREYTEARQKMTSLEQTHGDALREYLRPYLDLEGISSTNTSMTEWNRYRIARTLKK